MTKVFISYSHDSDQHRDFVRGIADRLRAEGLECFIDQYINGFPPEGWPRWMEKQIETADFVLLVCTETYLRRYKGEETDGGKGVNFEGVVISQTLYDHYAKNTKFIPVIPQHGQYGHVPVTLKPFSTYRLPEDYDTLYRLLTGQGKFIPPPVGEIRRKPSLLSRWFGGKSGKASQRHAAGTVFDQHFPDTSNHALVGREAMLAQLNQHWEQPSVRVLVLQAWGGVGKTALVNQWREQLQDQADADHAPQRVYCWSFQNQGSGRTQTSSGKFFSHALQWFGVEVQASLSEHDKGVQLAKQINRQRTLLILDGLEVFQPWNSVLELKDRLNDHALYGLLLTLAQRNRGLCVITTRVPLDKRLRDQEDVLERSLSNLPTPAAVQLLQQEGVKGKAAELEKLAKHYQRHAYSLVLVASYLKTHAKGDIRRLDTLPPLLADDGDDTNWQGRQIMQAYAAELAGTEDLGLLYVVSVFEQPVERGLIGELIRGILAGGYETALKRLNIARLTETDRWLACFQRLRKQGLLLGNDPEWLDLHPLVRAFFRSEFARRLGGVKNLVHRTLYDYYKTLPEKEQPDTLEEMQPLFSAVAHGCAAGLHQQALDEVFWPRVRREDEGFLVHKLGASSDDLATVAHFFTTPWQTPVAGLGEIWQAGVLNWAGFGLRALGRLREAVEPMQANVEMSVQQENWIEAAKGANNLSELQLTLGDLAAAVSSAAQSVAYADKSGDMFSRMAWRSTHADALHQAGQAALARELFQAAEALQQEHQPGYPRLYSLQGFQYCDLLLAQGETGAVLERAEQTLAWAKQQGTLLLDIALNQLSLGRAHLQQLLLPSTSGRGAGGEGLAADWLEQAVVGLRAAGDQDMLPHGLLARAALFRHTHDFARARQDLQEVFDSASGSGMRLFLVDWHLEMARLLLEENPPQSPFCKGGSQEAAGPAVPPFAKGGLRGISLQAHVAAAARLIQETGYHRRDKELAALQQVLP